MSVRRLFVWPLLRLVVRAAVVAAIVWWVVGPPVTHRVNDAVCGAVERGTRMVAEHDLAVLRERVEAAKRRIEEAEARRGQLVALLERAEAERERLAQQVSQKRALLREIAAVLATPGPVVMVSGKPYGRQVVEGDAARAIEEYEGALSRLRDLDGEIEELKAGLERIAAYMGRAEKLVASREALTLRLEERAQYQRLLRDLGTLLSDDGFESRYERARAGIAPVFGVGESPVPERDVLKKLADAKSRMEP